MSSPQLELCVNSSAQCVYPNNLRGFGRRQGCAMLLNTKFMENKTILTRLKQPFAASDGRDIVVVLLRVPR